MQVWISVINSKNIMVLEDLPKSEAFYFVYCGNTTGPSRTADDNRQLTIRINFLHQMSENIFAPRKCTEKKRTPRISHQNCRNILQ
jgi:hypothetical protein